MLKNTKKAALFLAVSAGLGGVATVHADTPITTFTPGDLVVLRGQAVGAQTAGTTVPAFLDEYSTSGGYIGTMNIPATSGGGNNALTLTYAGGDHEGQLELSPNGQYLTFTGYNTAANGSTGVGMPVTIGEISQNLSSLNTATQATGVVGAATRSAITVDGNEFYLSYAGTTAGATSLGNQGVQYVNGIGSGATQTAINNTWNTRYFAVLGNSLIAGSGSSTMGTANSVAPGANGHGLWLLNASAGSPAPTASLPTVNVADTADYQVNNNVSDGTSFVFLNQPSTTGTYGAGGPDVLYLAGGPGTAQQIDKFAFNTSGNGVFDLVGSATPSLGAGSALIGLTSETDPVTGFTDLFYTEAGKGVFELVDSSATAGALSFGASTQIVTAGTNAYDYGISFAPVSAVPEPTTLGLLTVVAGGLLSRRSRRRA